MSKTTSELMNELMSASSISLYLKENAKYMIDDDLSVYLTNILKKKQLTKSSIIKKTEISEVMGYQIFSGVRRPSRDSLLCICVAMELDIEEVQPILKIAGFAELSPKIKRDSIIIKGVCAGSTVAKINEMLYDNNEATLN